MIQQLEDKQSLALAIVSFIYFHRDPLSLFTTPCSETGEMELPLWLCKDTGSISCRRKKSVLFQGQNGVLELPTTIVPAKEIANMHDLTLLAGRKGFAWDILKYVLNYWWSEPHHLDSIGFSDELVTVLRKNLSEPKFTHRGKFEAKDVLEKVVMPILYEHSPMGETSTTTVLH